PPPRPPPFPYTTLFRSSGRSVYWITPRSTSTITTSSSTLTSSRSELCKLSSRAFTSSLAASQLRNSSLSTARTPVIPSKGSYSRSEEHTSELQSRENLV